MDVFKQLYHDSPDPEGGWLVEMEFLAKKGKNKKNVCTKKGSFLVVAVWERDYLHASEGMPR